MSVYQHRIAVIRHRCWFLFVFRRTDSLDAVEKGFDFELHPCISYQNYEKSIKKSRLANFRQPQLAIEREICSEGSYAH